MQNSSRQTRAPINKATAAGGWAPKAKDFASTRRFLAKQQQAQDLRKAAPGKPAATTTTPQS